MNRLFALLIAACFTGIALPAAAQAPSNAGTEQKADQAAKKADRKAKRDTKKADRKAKREARKADRQAKKATETK
jgi:hypothetical protein